MPRKLKTYQTSIGFFDLAVAAPSMKAALEAWGADSNLFHQGVAKESNDPKVVAATMDAPGVVLKRPVGSSGAFQKHSELPSDISGHGGGKSGRSKSERSKQRVPKRKDDPAAHRKAALAFKREQERRERERAKEEADRSRELQHRKRAIHQAERALNAARGKHEKKASAIQSSLEAMEKKSKLEAARWEKQRLRLESALRRAHQ